MAKLKLNFSKIHFPTALGLLILLVAIGVGVVMVRTRTTTNIGAEESITPRQVRITNVTDTTFTVSWLTDKNVKGLVRLGTENNKLTQQVEDDRDQLSGSAGQFELHHVTAKNLDPETSYFFKLESGGEQFDNNGQLFEIKTGPSLGSPPAADPMYGAILTTAGSPAEGILVYVNVANAAPLSALAKTNGNWALNLSTARTTDLSAYLTYDAQATIVNLLVQGGSAGTATAVTTTTNDSPVPDIALGQSYDFRAEETSNSEVDLADESGFSLDSIATNSGEATGSGEVTLENPSFDGEVLNATQPAFIGTGPVGTVLTIEVNSEDSYTGAATVDENGEWEFTPPDGLAPGEHSITIAYIDSEGDEQTFLRNFVVAAAGESNDPAIIATPSGETARTELPATDSGVPEPGSGELTLMLSLLGIGLLVGGTIARKKI